MGADQAVSDAPALLKPPEPDPGETPVSGGHTGAAAAGYAAADGTGQEQPGSVHWAAQGPVAPGQAETGIFIRYG